MIVIQYEEDAYMTNAEIGYRIYLARKENHATLEEVAKKLA